MMAADSVAERRAKRLVSGSDDPPVLVAGGSKPSILDHCLSCSLTSPVDRARALKTLPGLLRGIALRIGRYSSAKLTSTSV